MTNRSRLQFPLLKEDSLAALLANEGLMVLYYTASCWQCTGMLATWKRLAEETGGRVARSKMEVFPARSPQALGSHHCTAAFCVLYWRRGGPVARCGRAPQLHLLTAADPSTRLHLVSSSLGFIMALPLLLSIIYQLCNPQVLWNNRRLIASKLLESDVIPKQARGRVYGAASGAGAEQLCQASAGGPGRAGAEG